MYMLVNMRKTTVGKIQIAFPQAPDYVEYWMWSVVKTKNHKHRKNIECAIFGSVWAHALVAHVVNPTLFITFHNKIQDIYSRAVEKSLIHMIMNFPGVSFNKVVT